MAFTREVNDGVAVVTFDGGLTVYDAAAIRDELAECLDAHAGLTLDLTGVSECDVTGVQLLLSAGLTAGLEKKTFAIQGAGVGLTEVARGLGLDPEKVFATGGE